MNFKNKQAMRYGGKSGMATSYRTGGPGDDKGTQEEKVYGGKYKASELDAAIKTFTESDLRNIGQEAQERQEYLRNEQDPERARGAFFTYTQGKGDQGENYRSYIKSK